MTRRLYYKDCTCLEFSARVLDVTREGDGCEVLLDQTAFYPTGGGQPHDVGFLQEEAVTEVRGEDGSEQVWHRVSAPTALVAGMEVRGRVDAARRRDHTQQHSGQHILSQAFVNVAGMATESFHMGETSSTIDVAGVPGPEILLAVEEKANEVLHANVPVHIHIVGQAELDRFPIRRQTYHGERVRIIEVEGFDHSTCGGTHVSRSGEVGAIAILGCERVRKLTRVEFVCGDRVRASLHRDHGICRAAGQALSIGASGLVEQVLRLKAENQRLFRHADELFRKVAEHRARELRAAGRPVGEQWVVCARLADLTAGQLEVLAAAITAPGQTLALLAVPEGEQGRCLFLGAEGSPTHLGELMKALTAQYDGRGGGGPRQAQGVFAAERLDAVLESALAHLEAS